MIPSDPNYIPACPDEKVRESTLYKHMLSMCVDPYAPHSRDESLIIVIQESAAAESLQ